MLLVFGDAFVNYVKMHDVLGRLKRKYGTKLERVGDSIEMLEIKFIKPGMFALIMSIES